MKARSGTSHGAAVRFEQVQKSYDGRVLVVKNLNLDIAPGEFLTMLGPSGSGKTTCLMMLAGFEPATHGEIFLDDQPINNVPPHKRGIGMVFQNYALFPHMSVAENLAFPLELRNMDKREQQTKVKRALDMVELGAFGNRRPSQLSGGQQQRVAVARALVFDPDLVLMDEPLGALDALTRGNLQEEILNIWSANRRTAVLITNDVDEGIFMADRIIPLEPGERSGLGPEYRIELSRPRNKKALNSDSHFKKVRTDILNYLVQLGEAAKLERDDGLQLPDLQPIMPGTKSFSWLRRAS